MQAGGDAIYKAIETVGRARDATLSVLIVKYLESYPPAESAALLPRLYLALGRHEDAAAAALHAAHNEQQAGNYKVSMHRTDYVCTFFRRFGMCPTELAEVYQWESVAAELFVSQGDWCCIFWLILCHTSCRYDHALFCLGTCLQYWGTQMSQLNTPLSPDVHCHVQSSGLQAPVYSYMWHSKTSCDADGT